MLRSTLTLSLLASLAVAFLAISHSPPAEAAARTVSAKTLLAKLEVAPERARYSYDRKKFDHWTIRRGQCDTRETVLAQESKTRVRHGRGCSVIGGRWYDEYTGKSSTVPSRLDVSHRVAMAEAWRSGASNWSADRRRGFANDVGYKHSLLAVGSRVNRAKGDRDPARWLPSRGTCKYVARWVAVKYRWNLKVDAREKSAIEVRLESCGAANTRVSVPTKGKPEKKRIVRARPGNSGSGGSQSAGAGHVRGGVSPASRWNCPAGYPIKGNQSGIYHVPGGAYYSRTTPERCFATEGDAQRAGYRRSMR